MNKITGIRSVDFKITALGDGVVNWNVRSLPHSQRDIEARYWHNGRINFQMINQEKSNGGIYRNR